MTHELHQRFWDEQSWVANRRHSVGASESPVLYGKGYYGQNIATLFESKVQPREAPAKKGISQLDIGSAIEPGIRELFEKEHGYEVESPTPYLTHYSADYPFISATTDGVIEVDGKEGGLELKSLSGIAGIEWFCGNQVVAPLRVQIQCQHQMYVRGWDFVYAYGLIENRRTATIRIERHDKFIRDIVARIVKFWEHVSDRTMPPDAFQDQPELTDTVFNRLHPDDSGDVVRLPIDAANLLRRWKTAEVNLNLTQSALGSARCQLKAALGDATYGVLPDGQCISWKTQNAKYGTSRVLRYHKRVPRGVQAPPA